MNKVDEFLLAVRKLEKQYGLYLEPSEWLNVVEKEPSLLEGVLGCSDNPEALREATDDANVSDQRTASDV